MLFTNLAWKERLIINLVLDPGHQVVNILGCRALDRLLHLLAICPVVLVLLPGRHDGAGLLGAEVSDGAVQHVDLVEEVHSVYSHPLIQIFSFWQHHSQAQVAS